VGGSYLDIEDIVFSELRFDSSRRNINLVPKNARKSKMKMF
jgi:hypothetical protein